MLRKISISLFLFLSLLVYSCDVNDTPDYYVASSQSDVFHKPDCSYVKSISAQNKITFDTREQAISAGYHPCSRCKP